MYEYVFKPVLTGIFVLLVACSGSGGDGTGKQLPVDYSVSITPNKQEWEISPDIDPDTKNCSFYSNLYQDHLVAVSVTDSKNRGLHTEIIVSLTLSGNTFSLFPYAELYDDKNGDFIPQEDELVSDETDPLLITETDEYTGAKYLIVRMNLSCVYEASLTVVAGGASNIATFKTIEGG